MKLKRVTDKNAILTIANLRTYCIFKELYETEPFVYQVRNKIG